MKHFVISIIIVFSSILFAHCGELDFDTPLVKQLDQSVYKAPKIHSSVKDNKGSIQAIFYESLIYKGKPTRVFAYIGIPDSDEPVPAMVLVHGGGGKAFHKWVKIWNERGYAAIAMSLEGHAPNEKSGRKKHPFGGPSRYGKFDDVHLPIEEQWMYHAVSDIMLANSLLRSMPEVDPERIGITGISWGGILTSLISGVDSRFKCAIPVYGSGFLQETKGTIVSLNQDPEIVAKKKFWDPARHFVLGSIPTLWINGDSDGHFSVDITSKSYEATEDHSRLVIHPGMLHGHPPGWDTKEVPEIYVFADQILKGDVANLAKIIQQPIDVDVKLKYTSDTPMKKATVYYLNEDITYRKENDNSKHAKPGPWLSIPAELDDSAKVVKASLPETAKVYYVNIEDARGCVISSKLVEFNQ